MRILMVEDEPEVASFIARAMREDSYAVDISENGMHALRMASMSPFDAILLDARLPGLSGIEVCSRLRQNGIDSPILMLTARTPVRQRVEGLDAGADDCLAKPFALAELRARVRALIRRRFNRNAPLLRSGALELDRHRRCARFAGAVVHLTSKEFALLEFLLLRAPQIVTRPEIIGHVWDSRFDSGTNLVEVYIKRLRQKLAPHRAAVLIKTVRGIGYGLCDAD